jgi:hypothetical protein
MGAAKCTTLALEEECDDLVGAVSGGFECGGNLVVLAS